MRGASSLPAPLRSAYIPVPEGSVKRPFRRLRQARIHLERRCASPCYHGSESAVDRHMSLQIVTVMDPIGSIRIAKDSTFAMLLEAQRRGHRLLYVLPGGLSVIDGRAHARVAPLTVREDPA